MGIGLYVQAKIKGPRPHGKKPGRDRIFSDLKETITEFVPDPLMRELLAFYSSQHTLYVRIHPCAEDVEFTWQPEHSILASVKTSTAGPGFHAFLIDLLRYIGDSMNLDWDWQDENADEAGFALSGDFAELQMEMAVLWKSLCGVLIEQMEDNYESLMVNMPIQYPAPRLQALGVTPLGPLFKEDAETVKDCESASLAAIVPRYFIWWDREPGAAFWHNTGLSLMWCDVPWHVPYSENERKVCQLALDCMDRAKQLDNSIDLPQTDIDELASLIFKADDSEPQPPRQQGIGYHRLIMRHQLSGSWSLCFPGYYYEATKDDESELVYWFDNRTIRFSSFTVSGKEAADSTSNDLLGSPDEEEAADSEIIYLDKDHVQGWATISKTSEDGDDFWMLQGKSACSDSLAIITVCYVDPADKDWAIGVFKTIMHPQPKN